MELEWDDAYHLIEIFFVRQGMKRKKPWKETNLEQIFTISHEFQIENNKFPKSSINFHGTFSVRVKFYEIQYFYYDLSGH